jgi:hypothetical protein
VELQEQALVISTLRRLERALVRERAYIVVHSHVDDLVARWYAAVDRDRPLPDIDRFVIDMSKDGLYLPTFAGLHNYLDACRRDRRLPDRNTLVWVLLPWERWSSQPISW